MASLRIILAFVIINCRQKPTRKVGSCIKNANECVFKIADMLVSKPWDPVLDEKYAFEYDLLVKTESVFSRSYLEVR